MDVALSVAKPVAKKPLPERDEFSCVMQAAEVTKRNTVLILSASLDVGKGEKDAAFHHKFLERGLTFSAPFIFFTTGSQQATFEKPWELLNE